MLITFCFGVSSNLSHQKSPTAEILQIYFLQKIVLRKYMRKNSTVGLFCCNKFEETPKQKVINLSKLNKFHFKNASILKGKLFWESRQKNLYSNRISNFPRDLTSYSNKSIVCAYCFWVQNPARTRSLETVRSTVD